MVTSTKLDDISNFKNQIRCSVNALMKLVKDAPKKNALIENGQGIFLQVTLIKVPEVEEIVKRRISLKHPAYAQAPEVCLIVRDYIKKDRVKRTCDEKIDFTIARYEELLKTHKITGISNIMPYFQLKTEYNTYELKRKLVNRFDIFLCSSYLLSKDHFFNCLGKIFMEKNKYPIAVKLPKLHGDFEPNANSRIQSAIASSVFYIKPSSDNYSIKIGNTLNKKINLIENLEVVIDKIINSDNFIPGGFKNIRSMSIKSERSKAVPLYMSLASANDIPIPYAHSNVPTKETVEGEISTLPGKRVTVLPNGDIFINPIDESDVSEDEVNEHDEEEEEEEQQVEEEEYEKDEETDEEENLREKKMTKKKKTKKVKEEIDSVEEQIKSAEQRYLSTLDDKFESSDEEETEKKPVKKGRKEKGIKRKAKDDPNPVKKMKKGKIVKGMKKDENQKKLMKKKVRKIVVKDKKRKT